MNEIDPINLQALVRLLDDTDPEIFRMISDRIVSIGPEIVPFLEEEWSRSFDPLIQQRIERIIHTIQFNNLKNRFIEWRESREHDLLKGVILVARINYPDLDEKRIHEQLDKLTEMAKTETGLFINPVEKVTALNRVLFEFSGFRGNTANFHSPQNSFINTVLESRKGNPLLLSVVYSLVAQRCGMPVLGVNLPEHFILAWQERNPAQPFDYTYPDADILFYINAFSRGNIFNKEAIDAFLSKLEINPQPSFFIPCSNQDIIIRALRNLNLAFQKTGESEKQEEVATLIQIMTTEPA